MAQSWMSNKIKRSRKKSVLENVFASSFPQARYFENTGTKDGVSPPSARNLRSVFGIINATKKASANAVAPNIEANTMSLKYPRMRLIPMSKLTPFALYKNCVFSNFVDILHFICYLSTHAIYFKCKKKSKTE